MPTKAPFSRSKKEQFNCDPERPRCPKKQRRDVFGAGTARVAGRGRAAARAALLTHASRSLLTLHVAVDNLNERDLDGSRRFERELLPRYRIQLGVSRTLQGTHKTLHYCRESKRMKASEQIDDGASTPAAGVTEAMQVDDIIVSISTLDCIDIDCVRRSIIKDTFNSS
ncbi:hypothetical protein EVAR_95833_1 [Eumeta japonica]|uniref:Uncharacterized protein n=1 Tax=Eumeta variegata TaxID=151549 RepID=A0A4C1VLT1_EUMVA|nr:hypothetical protein EVAR_95833_1 [Eumeta japonica]